ncbi:hypothetical protein CDL15_Pgr004534 [Punica granatum]|uniref:Uncharacterized protein n=1 Tax=Punica granatum TaxID=22663 RepID=A0A218WPI1_PUNGR|nr:hypothetical protein CDL15_Pgr004534 [Punica granatum]PKI38963.1 hypothetical protein CRG98_040646 [Punica granatum]
MCVRTARLFGRRRAPLPSTSIKPIPFDSDSFKAAALICELIFSMGIVAVAHYAWLCRFSSSSSSLAAPPSKANKGFNRSIIKVFHCLPKPEFNSRFSDDCTIYFVDFAARAGDPSAAALLPRIPWGVH